MPSISVTLSSHPWMTSSKLRKGGLTNKQITHIYKFGGTFSSDVPRLLARATDLQYPMHINKINGKTVEQEIELPEKGYQFDDHVVRQHFVIRLYDLDIQQKASLEAMLHYTKETGLNLFQSSGLVVEGFGISNEMSCRNLIWVTGRMQVVVNSYPTWGDVIEVDTWCSAFTKHSLTISSKLTNTKTGKKILRVDSELMMMNETTRRLSAIPEELKPTVESYVRPDFDPLPVTNKYAQLRKTQKLEEEKADCIRRGIRPLWFDLDPNQHVNHVKYISWILEGTPESMRDSQELEAIFLEYRRECRRESVLNSLSAVSPECPQEYDHFLRLEDGNEVTRAKTIWRPKGTYN